MNVPARRLTIVIPVYDDWTSATRLIGEIGGALAGTDIRADVVVVDDGSPEVPPARLDPSPGVAQVESIRLATNLGHQRAIAVGLMALAERPDLDLVAVMDADGEDRPEDLRRLVERAIADPARAIVAQRARRSEGLAFKAFYWLYRQTFRLLTGQRLAFGNFSVLPAGHVRRLAGNPQIWNNFAATLLHSRLPIAYLPTARGVRYAGQSRMNFVGLVAHGLGAMSVLSEAVFVRVLFASLGLLLLSGGLALAALYLKLFTGLALPNWATTVLGFALVISLQALMTPILMAFLLLNNRATIQPPPAPLALAQIAERRMLA